jgi:hypothetical protein
MRDSKYMDDKTRTAALKLIWRHTHKDFRGVIMGEKCVLVLRPEGTCLAALTDLTDAEVAHDLAYAARAETKRLAAKATKKAAK